MTPEELTTLEYDWLFWGRPAQQAPEGFWNTWLALCGRGWGKTETGAQWVRKRVLNGSTSIAIIAETQKDLEEVMVPRIIKVHPPSEAPTVRYKPVRLIWPNGALAWGYNGTEPDQLRGPEFDTAWVDELAKYRHGQEVWDMLQFTMRVGDPRVLVTTTPRPTPVIKEIIRDKTTVTVRGSTEENAENLPKTFIDKLRDKYEGTRLGRQELHAEVLDDFPGALWTRAMIDTARKSVVVPDMQRIVVSVDPSGARGENDEGADSIGIVVVGKGVDGHFYVLADRTCKLSPAGWGRQAIVAYNEFKADRIVAERNYGGAMVEYTIKSLAPNVSFAEVTASRGKVVRAEPISSFYEQEKVHHVAEDPRSLEDLEDQLCQITKDGYMGEGSPDRADAMVWGVTYLSDVAAPIKISSEVLQRSAMVRRRG